MLGLLGTAATRSSTPAPPPRFAGEAAEPRPGLASGHIPGSRNAPQSEFFNADNSWKRGDELRAAFDAAGVDLAKPMVTTCGSGVTAGGDPVRRASARQGGRAALRRQLVRMGRRSRDAQGDGRAA